MSNGMNRLWMDSAWRHGEARWQEQVENDGSVYLPNYLDNVELGVRVADYLWCPAEEQMLEDMMAGVRVNMRVQLGTVTG